MHPSSVLVWAGGASVKGSVLDRAGFCVELDLHEKPATKRSEEKLPLQTLVAQDAMCVRPQLRVAFAINRDPGRNKKKTKKQKRQISPRIHGDGLLIDSFHVFRKVIPGCSEEYY
jgi:hypothetical protein